MASLKDIARLANVTPATVSRALRGHSHVSPATVNKIRSAADALGYTHNLRISNLMKYVRSSAQTHFRETLAFIWPHADAHEGEKTYQLRRFESGAIERARHLGYGVDVFYYNKNEKKKRWSTLHKTLRARGIRGLIWGPVLRSSHARLTMPLESYASAAIGEAFVHPRLPHARFDHFVGMRNALHQLKRQGCRRIGLAVESSLNVRATPLFLASFVTSGARGHRKPDELTYMADVLKAPELLTWALAAKPDAILLSHDIHALADLPNHPRISWPLKIASLNRLSPTPRFSGIDQRQDLIASHACDLVIEQLGRNHFGVPEHAKIVLVEGEWQNLAESTRVSQPA